jgi:hypothetical protein
MFLVVRFDNLKAGYFMKKIKLSNKGRQIVNKLLELQKVAIDNDYTKLLKSVNEKLYQINQIWRNAMIKANQSEFENYQLLSRLNNATCYKF